MSVDITRASVVGPAAAATPTSGPAVAPGASVEQIAQEFEAMLLAQMVKQMRQSFLSEEEGGEGMGLGMQTMTEAFTQAPTTAPRRLARERLHGNHRTRESRHVRGEANLSLGRAVEYGLHGFSGIVNLMPFACMPGTIVKTPGTGWTVQIIMGIMLILNILFIVDFVKSSGKKE